MKKISVAFCTDGIYPLSLGGMQRHSRLLIEELARFPDLEITVIHPHQEKIFVGQVKEITIEGINTSKNYLLECYSYSKRAYSILLAIRPDVIYTQGLSVWYRANYFKDRLVLNPHGLEPYQGLSFKDRLFGLPFRVVFDYLFKRAAVVISLGGRLTDILKRKTARVVEIPNASSIRFAEKRVQAASGPVKVLFLARFAHNKGIDILFAAIDQLQSQGILSRFQFTLAGTGPLFRFYEVANKYENVHLPGLVSDDDITRLCSSHDLFVLPTLFEGMPTVVLEAMSFGLPVIVSDVGATRVLVDESNGKVIRPGSVDELVTALKWFLELPIPERQKLSDSSRLKFQEKFTWPKVAEQYRQLFINVAATN